jgi:hypothetical protein
VFDLAQIADQGYRNRVAQALDGGLAAGQAAREPDGLRAVIAGLMGAGGRREVTFFSDQTAATRGTNYPPLSSVSSTSGAAYWYDTVARGWGQFVGPVSARTELRIWLNPTGGAYQYTDGATGRPTVALWVIANKTWHELAHLASPFSHVEESSPYTGPWRALMDAVRRDFPDTLYDPVTGRHESMARGSWTRLNVRGRARAFS